MRHAWSIGLPLLLLATIARGEDAPAAAGTDPGAVFDRLDANGDGQVAEDEVAADQRRLYDRLRRTADKDQDGKLSREEFVAGLKEEAGEPAEPAAPATEPAAPRGRDAISEAYFRRLDANGDGKIVPDEVLQGQREGIRRLLPQADRDGDGALNLAEMKAVGNPVRQAAGGQPQPGMRLLEALDADRDGQLSAEEIAAATGALKRLDANNDGKLSRDELAGASGQQAAAFGQAMLQRLKQADANGDGKISADEAPGRVKENFAQIDANGDGFLDEQEIQQAAPRLFGGSGAGFLARIREADANGDGKISREEAPNRLKESFDQADANGDGFLDQAELQQVIARFGGQPEGGGLLERWDPLESTCRHASLSIL